MEGEEPQNKTFLNSLAEIKLSDLYSWSQIIRTINWLETVESKVPDETHTHTHHVLLELNLSDTTSQPFYPYLGVQVAYTQA